VLEDDKAIFIVGEGSRDLDVKDFLIEQERCQYVQLEKQMFYGKHTQEYKYKKQIYVGQKTEEYKYKKYEKPEDEF